MYEFRRVTYCSVHEMLSPARFELMEAIGLAEVSLQVYREDEERSRGNLHVDPPAINGTRDDQTDTAMIQDFELR